MRILLVTPSYYPNIGGVEYVVKSIAERLAALGHETTVVTGDPKADKPREEEINGVRVIRWPTWAPSGAYHIPKKKDQLRNLLRKLLNDADAVHVHSAHAVLTVCAAAAARRINPDVRIIFTPHYHGTGHSALRRLLWISWRRYVAGAVEAADAIHAVSPREARLFKSHYPQSRGKIAIIPNGVEEDVFRHRWRGADSDYMMYAGRIEKYKRLETAVELARELGLRLLVVGRGPHREKLKRYARRRRAGPRRPALHHLLRAQGDGLRCHCRRRGAGALYAHRREMQRGDMKRNLERERFDICSADCAMFTEVIDYPTIGIASEDACSLSAPRRRTSSRSLQSSRTPPA